MGVFVALTCLTAIRAQLQGPHPFNAWLAVGFVTGRGDLIPEDRIISRWEYDPFTSR